MAAQTGARHPAGTVSGHPAATRLGTVVVLAAALAGFSCAPATGVDSGTIAYELVRVEWPPSLMGEEPQELEWQGTLELYADGTCRRVVSGTEGDLDTGEMGWPCTWTREGARLELSWNEAAPDQPQLPNVTSLGTVEGAILRLEVRTGIQCVTTPCPTGWLEVYEQLTQVGA